MFKKISASLIDKFGKISHTKISSYFILFGILLSSLVFLTIDVINAIKTWQGGEEYVIPGAHITIFAMLLAHHLALLGIKKYSETKQTKKLGENPTGGGDSGRIAENPNFEDYGGANEEEG